MTTIPFPTNSKWARKKAKAEHELFSNLVVNVHKRAFKIGFSLGILFSALVIIAATIGGIL